VTPASKKIWVVDDEPDVLTYLTTVLEDEEYQVQGFDSAEGFLEQARMTPPDLVCLDIMMPSKSGLAVYRELREAEEFRTIPVIIVSGYSRREEFVNGEFERLMGGNGMPEPDGFVEKPVKIDVLVKLVRRLLERGQA
jgi:DNA-binding response OmpR family regulator